MEIGKNLNLPFSFEKGSVKKHHNFFETNLRAQKSKLQCSDYEFADFEFLSKTKDEDFLNFKDENYFLNIDDLPNGVSRYEHRGARYTIYKHDDDYQSEFYCPESTNRGEFFKRLPNLKPENLNQNRQKNNSTIKSINGELDEAVLQGNSGDCWLLVALNSLNSTKYGKQIIKDSITVNNDNTVTVSFRGIGISYTLTANEIARHDTDKITSDSYSNGDNDALVIELATEKLWKDINSGKIKLPTKNENINDIERSIENGGLPSQMIYYLTGIEANEYYIEKGDSLEDLSSKTINSILDKAQKSGNYCITFGIYDGVHTAKLTDGSEYSLDVGYGGHALSVKKITDNTVTFVNPWDSSVEYTMTRKEFANLGIGYMCSSDLSKTKYKEEITDMSGYTSNGDNGSSYFDNEYNYDYSSYVNDNSYSKIYSYLISFMNLFEKMYSMLDEISMLRDTKFFDSSDYLPINIYKKRN